MKHVIKIVLLVALSSGSMLSAMYEDPSDYKVVNAIHAVTHLTQNDADRLKILFLGPLGDVAALGAAGYSMYRVGQAARGEAGVSGVVESTVFKTIASFLQNYGPEVSENKKNVLSSPWLWAILGATGTGVVAHKLLYTRVEQGVLNQVKRYVNYCRNLEIYRKITSLDKLGTSAGNAAWAASNIARLKGLEDLLMQGNIALALLDQLYYKNADPGVMTLRNRVATIISFIGNNKSIIENAANLEMNARIATGQVNIQGAQQQAQINLMQQQASALRVGKWSLAMTAINNAFKTGMETLVYIHDNEGKIAAGAITMWLFGPRVFNYIKEQLGFGKPAVAQ